jgi:hypothetical protein
MEFKLDGMDIQFGEGCEFELPNYMTRILPENISRDSNKNNVIIAAGADPSDGKITLVTLSGNVFIFDARSFYIPDGPAVPDRGGCAVFLENVNGRWPGSVPGFWVESDWILQKSVSALEGAILQTNYIHENKAQ